MATEFPEPKPRCCEPVGPEAPVVEAECTPAVDATDVAAPNDAAPDVAAPAGPAPPQRHRPGLIRASVLRDRATAFAESRGCQRMRFKRSFAEAFSSHMEAVLEQCFARAMSNRRRTLMASDV